MIIRSNISRKWKKAQALVEFALVLPILVASIMAIFEFGLLVKNYLGVNYALNQASKTAALCRGTINADIKVIRAILENCVMIDSTMLSIEGPNGTTYGPFKLDSHSNVVKASDGQAVNSIAQEIFFYKDNGTPNDLRDDFTVNPAVAGLPSYASITVSYRHVLLNAAILGFESQGTFNLKMNAKTRLAPSEE